MNNTRNDLSYTLNHVRSYLNQLAQEEISLEEAAFAMAFVATEMGLKLAERPESIYPLILTAITRASVQFLEESENDDDEQDYVIVH